MDTDVSASYLFWITFYFIIIFIYGMYSKKNIIKANSRLDSQREVYGGRTRTHTPVDIHMVLEQSLSHI